MGRSGAAPVHDRDGGLVVTKVDATRVLRRQIVLEFNAEILRRPFGRLSMTALLYCGSNSALVKKFLGGEN
jgi:hypothetical protein